LSTEENPMKQYRITLEEHTFDVKVLDDPRQAQVRVEVDGKVFTVGIEPMPGRAAPPGSGRGDPRGRPPVRERLPKFPETSEASSGTVTAPLPGVIKSIAVRPGQRVAASDELLVIEAMKMDNVIRAPRAGAVGTLYVTDGRQVAYGEPLLEVNNEQ